MESAYVSIRDRRLTNRGFMRGPVLPIYGSGAIMMLVVSAPFQDNVVLTYVAGCLGATVLEYVTGVLMEKLFKVRYWDYSRRRFNFQGHVCLATSLSWGGLTILTTEIVHLPVESFVLSIPERVLTVVTLVLTAIMFADFALSVKAAIDLRDLLEKMGQVKHEMAHILKRLDAILATAGEAVENRKDALRESVSTVKEGFAGGIAAYRDEFVGSMTELKAGIENKLEGLKKLFLARPDEYPESVKEEVFELRTRYKVNSEVRSRMSRLKDFIMRSMIRSNPTMTSVKFEEELEEIKKHRKKGPEGEA